nr:hypothetical protein CTI12_AA123990 [Tanacetum cinerariifolium]
MNGGSLADRTVNPTLSNMLNKSVFLASNTIIGQDGKVHSHCGLRLADIHASVTYLKQTGTSSASKYAHTHVRRRAVAVTYASKKPPKGAAITSSDLGVPAVYHNLGPPSYQCSMCNATMWYNERSKKAIKAVTLIFSLCCQEGSLLLAADVPSRYAQLYFFDTQNKIRNRILVFMSKKTPETVDQNIVAGLIQMLDHTSAMAKSFRMAKEWCHSNSDVNFGLRLLSERTTTRQYNAHTVSEVAALIINDFGDGLPTRDIIVNKNNTGPQRISELHPSYMALQYPLLFRIAKMDTMKRYLITAMEAIERQNVDM